MQTRRQNRKRRESLLLKTSRFVAITFFVRECHFSKGFSLWVVVFSVSTVFMHERCDLCCISGGGVTPAATVLYGLFFSFEKRMKEETSPFFPLFSSCIYLFFLVCTFIGTQPCVGSELSRNRMVP